MNERASRSRMREGIEFRVHNAERDHVEFAVQFVTRFYVDQFGAVG